MKYIRTKDGRIAEVRSRRIVLPVFPTGEPRVIFNYNIHEKDVIKQADTIEELCDCFVESGKHYIWDKKYCSGLTLEQVENFTANKFELYGAIWTNQGLIYVAKINEKGDLELL